MYNTYLKTQSLLRERVSRADNLRLRVDQISDVGVEELPVQPGHEVLTGVRPSVIRLR